MLEPITQVSNEESGKTENPQVSTEAGQTEVKTDGYEVDLSKTYKINQLTGEAYTGQEIRQMINESKLLRKKQSDFDKATAEMQKKEAEYKQAIEKLTTDKALTEANSRISRIENLKSVEEEYDPFAPLEETKPTTQYKPIESPVRQIDPEEIEKRILNEVEERLNRVEQQRAQIEEIQGFRKARITNLTKQYKSEFPVLTEAEIGEIVSSLEVARNNELEANNYVSSPDNQIRQRGYELIVEADKYTKTANTLLAKATVKQERYDIQQQQQKELMTRNTAQKQKTTYTDKISNRADDDADFRKALRQEALEEEHQRKAMKASG
jgi:hypothetical protein